MKKRVIHLFIAAGFLLLAGACSNEPTAKESMDQYVDKWNEQKFEEMYEQLSAEAQKSISKDDFIKRNQSIYEQIGVSDLKVSTIDNDEDEKNKEKNDSVTIPYKVSMKTLAGPVSFQGKAKLVKEKRRRHFMEGQLEPILYFFTAEERGDHPDYRQGAN